MESKTKQKQKEERLCEGIGFYTL